MSAVASARYSSAILQAPRRTRVQPLATPSLGARQVGIRLQGCGICASNLPVWEGRPWFSYPLKPGAPGHEGWGIIEAVGHEAGDWQPGERVAFLSAHAYAEYDVAEASSLVRLPQELDHRPFPGEPLACVMNIFERSGIQAGQHVAIIGAGFLGLLLTQLAAGAGAAVTVLSRRPYALELAHYAGARALIDCEDGMRARRQALDMTAGRGFERVIEAVGVQSTLDLATELAGERGRLIIAGYHQDGARQVNLQQWNWRGLDVVNAHERAPSRYVAGMQSAIAAVSSGKLDPFPLITHEVPLQQLDRAFELMSTRPPGFVKAVVTFGHGSGDL